MTPPESTNKNGDPSVSPEDHAALTEFVQEMARRYLLLESGLASGVDDITKRELQVLELIALYEVSTVTEVAKVGKVPLSTASWIVNNLVEKDYLQRSPDPDDRRVVRLALGPGGQRVMAVLQSAFSAMAEQILAAADEQESAALVALARRLTAELHQQTEALIH